MRLWGKQKQELKSDQLREELKKLGDYIPKDHQLESRITTSKILHILEEPIEFTLTDSGDIAKLAKPKPEDFIDEMLRRLGLLNDVLEQIAIPFMRAKDERKAAIVMYHWRLFYPSGKANLVFTRNSILSTDDELKVGNNLVERIEALNEKDFVDPDLKKLLQKTKSTFEELGLVATTETDKLDTAMKAINSIIEEITPYGLMIKDCSYGDVDITGQIPIVIHSVTPPQQQPRYIAVGEEELQPVKQEAQ